MKDRRQSMWGVLILTVLLLAAVSCEQSTTSPSGTTTQQTNNNDQVAAVSLSTDEPLIINYLGLEDSLIITATAVDEGQVGVENAVVAFSIVTGRGAISRVDNATDASGKIRAKYRVTLSDAQETVTIMARVNGKEALRTVEIVPRDVRLSMRPAKRDFKVALGAEASVDLTLTVSDLAGVGVVGIPVRVERTGVQIWQGDEQNGQFIDDTGHTVNPLLTPVTTTDASGSAVSTLTLNPVTRKVKVYVRASINVPGSQKGIQSKDSGSLRERLRGLFQPVGNPVIAGNGRIEGVAASITSVIDSVVINPYEGSVSRIYLWVEPEHLVVPRNQIGVATVYAVAFDHNNNGIRDLQIPFILTDEADGLAGVLSQTQFTDSTGEAKSTLRTNRQYGNWRITALYPDDPERSETTYINVEEAPEEQYFFDMVAYPRSIQADNGITTSTVNIRLYDQDNIAVAGDTVYIAATFGYIQSRVLTDSTGRYTAPFTDIGIVAQDPPARVTAIYRKNGVTLASRSVNITIDPVARPSKLRLYGPTTPLTVHPTDSIAVTVRVLDEYEDPVQNGTPVFFADPTLGHFSPAVDSTNNNIARSYYFWGTHAENSIELAAYTIFDPIEAPMDTFWSYDEYPHFFVNILPGRAAFIRSLLAARSTMSPDDPTPNLITCTVVDSFNNPVSENVGVQFSTDKGTITPSASTGPNGQAIAWFSAGAQSGLARIQANLNSILDSAQVFVNIQSGSAISIQLSTNIPGTDSTVTSIQVAGTGGNETAIVYARVLDSGGNPVDEASVNFWLYDSPLPRGRDSVAVRMNGSDGSDSINVNSPNYSPGGYWDHINNRGRPFETVRTNAGRAQVPISAGSNKGIIVLKAWVYLDQAHLDSVVAAFSGLQVVAGPPNSVDVDVNMDGEDGMGATWELEVSARVQDARGNNVADNYAVIFGSDDGFGNDDDRIHIEESYVGSENKAGDPSPGVAYTILTYNSEFINQTVTIYAEVQTPTGMADDRFTFRLPIQDAQGLMYTNLLNWNYPIRNDEPDVIDNIAEFYIACYVSDGHDHYVNGQEVRFLTNKGKYYHTRAGGANRWVVGNYADTDITGSTSPRPNPPTNDGWASLWLVITLAEGFPEPVAETTAQASCVIIGYRDATVEPIVLNLYNP